MRLAEDGVVRLRAGDYWVPTRITSHKDKLILQFPYNVDLLGEVKSMLGSRWDPDARVWSVRDCERNHFQLSYLMGEDPYRRYDQELTPIEFDRPLRAHQKDMVQIGLTYRRVLLAAEQGLGKSLVAIEVAERSGVNDWLYVGPRSAMASFECELSRWDAKIAPSLISYEGLVRLVENWPPGRPVPGGVFLDECQRVKTASSQRSAAAARLTEAMRNQYGDDAFVIGLSGAPAPKDPIDWHSQTEIICPGWLKEGTPQKLEARLSLVTKVQGPMGNYPKRICWFDDERRCKECGLFEEDHSVEASIINGDEYHAFTPSINEVAYLAERMKGLVYVYRKKDHLSELPEMQYRTIECRPTPDILAAAKLVIAGAETAIGGFTQLRQLSDGFLYTQEIVGQETCPKCHGTLVVEQAMPVIDEEALEQARSELYNKAAAGGIDVTDPEGLPIPEHLLLPDHYKIEEVECWKCGGTGEVPIYRRTAETIDCPKDDALRMVLEAHDDDGRLVVYGGHTASVDRVAGTLDSEKWEWISLDGRGWRYSPGIVPTGLVKGKTAKIHVELLHIFQEGQDRYPRVCFLGQADAAGTGLTLTASSEIVFFSNSFNYDSRGQSEHRIHRPGMDVNKGALVTDLIHLPSDATILKNLKGKKRLQEMSLGVLKEGFYDHHL